MNVVQSPLRYAHMDGHADVCFTFDGKHILTCGRDGDIRVWLSIDDDDPESISAGERALTVICIPHKGVDRIYVTTDQISVQALTFPKGDRDGTIVKFEALVSHIAADKNAQYLVAGGQDFTIKVISVEDSSVVHTFENLNGPVLSVAICPNCIYVAASSGDGSLRIFSLTTKSLVKEISCVPVVNDFENATVLCRPSFEPLSGTTLAYPDKTEIVLMDTASWSRQAALQNSRATGEFSIAAYSPCGRFIAASTVSGCICLWDVSSLLSTGYVAHPQKEIICGLAWNPTGNGGLAYVDRTGQLGALAGCSQNNLETTEQPLTEPLFEHVDSDDDNENAISLEKLKSETLKLFNTDDSGDESRPLSVNTIHDAGPTIAVTPLQPPFQPGSTPVHLVERYLLWNTVGIVRAFDGDGERTDAYVDVTFHDITLHRSLHLRNNSNYTMSCLSTTVLGLASENQLYCIPLSGGKEWTSQLPESEEVLALTGSDTLVAIATDRRFLRIFSVNGNQRHIISIPGPVVSLASQNTSILVVYHGGPGVGKDQNLSLKVIVVAGLDLKTVDVRLPLSPAATLAWIGHTKSGAPAIYDSEGILRIFLPKSGAWFPVFDHASSRKGVSDGLFIVSVNDEEEIIDAISCKGSCYPPITPRPLVAEFLFSLPLCDSETEKSKIEDLFSRSCLADYKAVAVQKKLVKSALELFSLACRTDFDHRALELVQMMAMADVSKFVQITSQYATRRGRTHLSEKIILLQDTMGTKKCDNDAAFEKITEIETTTNNCLAFLTRKKAIKNKSENDAPKPLLLKRNENRVQICKKPVEQNADTDVNKESQIFPTQDEVPSPLSLRLLDKGRRNPFKKSENAAQKNEINPFNVSGSVHSDSNELDLQIEKGQPKATGFGAKLDSNVTTNKRKQPDSETSEVMNINKQSKLSAFMFQKS